MAHDTITACVVLGNSILVVSMAYGGIIGAFQKYHSVVEKNGLSGIAAVRTHCVVSVPNAVSNLLVVGEQFVCLR